MKRLTIEQIEAIRERAEKATQGATPEWYVDEDWKGIVRCSWSGDLLAQSIPTESDAEFIANARQDIPALLAEVVRLKSEIRRLEIENKTLERVATERTIKVERKYEIDYDIGY